MNDLGLILTLDIARMKSTKELVDYDEIRELGFSKVPEKYHSKLSRLAFAEYEPYNTVCNILQIPYLYVCDQVLVI